MEQNKINQISEDLLLAVKMQQPVESLIAELKNLDLFEVQSYLKNDALKKAFWVNIYNAYFQILRKVNNSEKPKIFTQKLIEIANSNWSLDDIEHGILRHYRYKYSLGYAPQLFVSKTIKNLAVNKIDYRIHFALNCGAVSCPPIAFYKTSNIERQLEMATLSFLEAETDCFEDKKEVHVSRIFLWFLGDFGGKMGIRKILKEKLDLNTTGYKIIFKKYSWDEQLDIYDDGVIDN